MTIVGFATERAQHAMFHAAVSAVQLEMLDEVWKVDSYGSLPMPCAGGYRYSLRRAAPAHGEHGWRIPGGPEVLSARVRSWLEDSGYTSVREADDPELIPSTLVFAKPEVGLAELSVRFLPGAVRDSIILIASSVCFAGDRDAMMRDLFPRGDDGEILGPTYPGTQHPATPPIFGAPAVN